jgi:hypothetical protein
MKHLLLLFQFCIALQSHAEWIPISQSEKTEIYIDYATVRNYRGNVRAWTLWDYSYGGSAKQLKEANCSDNELRTSASLNYKGRMGEGVMWMSIDEPSRFSPVAPGTVGETVLRELCLFAPKK